MKTEGNSHDANRNQAKGRLIDFTNAVVIFTTNVGSERVLEQRKSGVKAKRVCVWFEFSRERPGVIQECEKSKGSSSSVKMGQCGLFSNSLK